MADDLDFTGDEYDPPTMKVRIDKLTGVEQRIVEKHIGCSLMQMQDGTVQVGAMSEAIAYCFLKRRNPTKDDDSLWDEAGRYHVEIVNKEQPTPTSEGGSTPSSPSAVTSVSPSPA